MRLGILFLFLWSTNGLWAQNHQDSIPVLDEVSVSGSFEKQFLPGNDIIIPKKETRHFYNSQNITETLAQQSSLYFKTYGNGGMLSTIAFRGTNASQTSVLWNNFNINSYTLGQTDFSLIPNAAIEELTIIPGSGSSMGGNGAFGGAILLNSNSRTNNPFIEFSQSLASFGSFHSSIVSKYGFKKVDLSTRIYFKKAKNNFTIPNRAERQQNAAYDQKGIVQSLNYQINSHHNLKADFWWHDNYRQIQPPIGTNVNLNDQSDENLRSQITYQYDGNGILKIGSGFFQDEMLYRNGDARSYNKVNRIESFSSYKRKILNNHQVKFSVRHNHIQAKNDSYVGEGAVEDRYSITGILEGEFFKEWNYAFHLRQQLVQNVQIPITPYIGVSKNLINAKHHALKIKANTSYNFRLPTLNDRFWQSSGEPNLNAEKAWNKEFGLNYQYSGLAQIHYKATAFHNLVDNWIQWTPDENGQFRPRNIKKVLARGIENQLDINTKINPAFDIQTSFNYSFTKSTVKESESNPREVGKQLIYTPVHKATASFVLSWKNLSLQSFNQWTGKVQTTSGNLEFLAIPAFMVNDVGVKWNWKALSCHVKAKNIFNKQYQVYSGYAMPGRNYQLSINYKLNFTK